MASKQDFRTGIPVLRRLYPMGYPLCGNNLARGDSIKHQQPATARTRGVCQQHGGITIGLSAPHRVRHQVLRHILQDRTQTLAQALAVRGIPLIVGAARFGYGQGYLPCRVNRGVPDCPAC